MFYFFVSPMESSTRQTLGCCSEISGRYKPMQEGKSNARNPHSFDGRVVFTLVSLDQFDLMV